MVSSFDIPPVPDDSYQLSPFTPTFGAIPPRLADRQQLVNAFARMLDQGPGARGQATLVTGQRGMGKSVMLGVFREVAASRGWISAHAQASPGFAERLTSARIPEALSSLDQETASKTRVTGGSVNLMGFGGSVATSSEDRFPVTPDFEHQVMAAADILTQRGSGLLITLDEVHRSNLDELRQITDAMSTAVAEGAPVAFAGAGLPTSINDLVNDDVSTYLRRAERVDLGLLTDAGAREGLATPIAEAGKTITPDALDAAVSTSGRYPYLVQLIGDESFKQAGGSETITVEHVRAATAEARESMFRQIHAPTLAELSDRDRHYLYAMTPDQGTSRTAEVAQRMGMDTRNAGTYRDRLLASGVIEAPEWGRVSYSLPFTREYLIDNPGHQGQRDMANIIETTRAVETEAATTGATIDATRPTRGSEVEGVDVAAAARAAGMDPAELAEVQQRMTGTHPDSIQDPTGHTTPDTENDPTVRRQTPGAGTERGREL